MPSTPRTRHVARVLLLDEEERVLLFRATGASGRPFWFPTGGGIERGESAEQAAVREVAEETGLVDVILGSAIWHLRHVVEWLGTEVHVDDRWFMARVEHFEISTDGWTTLERSVHTGHRWWTLDELRATTDDLRPRALPVHLERLLRDGPPSHPVDVGP